MRLSYLAFSLAFGLVATAPAHAAVVINDLKAPPGPYNLGNPVGTIAALIVNNSDTYDFPFEISGGTFDVLVQLQASTASPPDPRRLKFSLFSGDPNVSPGTFLIASGPSIEFGPAIDTILSPGQYYLELTPADHTFVRALVSGGLAVSAVPEPASWALAIGGLSLLGLALRRRRSALQAV
jgi:hypothetical protein